MRHVTLQIALLTLAAVARAQSLDPTPGTTPPIELDGSIGPGGDVPFVDGTWQIGDQLGEYRGDSLLHSFGRFDVAGGQTAEFSAANGTPERVLARVTWGERSDIEGMLRSTIPGADLYLINPAGIRLAGGAQLDVQGSFVATTAGRIDFGAGNSFSVDPTQPLPLLTVEEPSSYGFLPQAGGTIEIDQIDRPLRVPAGETLAFVGRDVDVFGGGRIIVTSPGSEIAFVAAGPGVDVPADLASFDPQSIPSEVSLGRVEIRGSRILASNPAGSVIVRSGRMRLENATIGAVHGGASAFAFDQAIDFSVRGEMSIESGSSISAGTTGAVPGGDMLLSADLLSLSTSEILSATTGTATPSGSGAELILRANTLSLRDGGSIRSESRGTGHGGAIRIETGLLDASDAGFNADGTHIGSTTTRATGGNAGNIAIDADAISLHDGAQIFSSTSGSGNTGAVQVEAGSIELSGIEFDPTDPAGLRNRASLIETRVLDGAAGNGGDVSIDTQTLHVSDGAEVGTTTLGLGNAGNVVVNADSVTLDGGPAGPGVLTSDALNEAPDGGDGGSLRIDTDRLSLLDGGQITTSTRGFGNAGSIAILAGDVEISGRTGGNGSAVFAQTLAAGLEEGGDAGSVLIDTTEGTGNVSLRDGGSIAVKTTNGGNAGTAEIRTRGRVLLDDGTITASTEWTGDAGDVVVSADELEIRGEQAGIFAQTLARGLADGGDAGSVRITTANDVFLHDTGGDTGAGGIFVETNNAGAAGTIDIDASGRVILDNSRITASATEDAGAPSGSIDILAARGVFLSNRSVIGSRTAGRGQAGTIFIDAGPAFEARDSSVTTAASNQSTKGGGVIEIAATERIVLTDSEISSSVSAGTSKGGDIGIPEVPPEIAPAGEAAAPPGPRLMVVNRSSIIAKAQQGDGGRIFIRAGTFIVSGGSEINADSADAELNSERAEPAQEYLDVAGLLRTSCGAGSEQAGSFVVARVAGLPASPEGPLPAPLWSALAKSSPSAGAAPISNASDADARVVARADGCQGREEL